MGFWSRVIDVVQGQAISVEEIVDEEELEDCGVCKAGIDSSGRRAGAAISCPRGQVRGETNSSPLGLLEVSGP